ncbi:MAG: hypothetical protein FWE37_09085 [Spirochaetaceae bacterium]|nr:hypothetical protein [Spirochaetaceae bacterium]
MSCLEAAWEGNGWYNQEINHIFMVSGITKDTPVKALEEHLEVCWLEIASPELESLLPFSMQTVVKNVLVNNIELNYMAEM